MLEQLKCKPLLLENQYNHVISLKHTPFIPKKGTLMCVSKIYVKFLQLKKNA